MYYRLDKTSFGQKEILSYLLSQELGFCKYKINASYEWKRPERILAVCLSQDNEIELHINLNMGRKNIFPNLCEENEVGLRYRAYFIISYMKCIESAAATNPETYYSGLVTLCAINSLCGGKKVVSYSPINNRVTDLRPIDIFCAFSALTRLSIERGDTLPAFYREECRRFSDYMLTYSLLPEISYKKHLPVYSVLSEIKDFGRNIESGRCKMTDYQLFKCYSERKTNELNLDSLASISAEMQDLFWSNVVIRLSVLLGESVSYKTYQESFVAKCIESFKEDTAKYYFDSSKTTNTLLMDNLDAVKRLAGKMEKVFINVTSKSGMLHFY